MAWTSVRGLITTALVATLALGCGSAPPAPAAERFIGTTPAGREIRTLLGIPGDAPAEIIEWDLSLRPDRYLLRLAHGATAANRPGLGSDAVQVERTGTWTATTGSGGRVLRLAGAVDLREVGGPDVLAVLNPDSTLMIGDSGWSYTLNRAGRAERPVDPGLAPPDTSYAISPVAGGPAVFGVFEGRTPCQGIAAELGVGVDPGCIKAKWRVTLFHEAGRYRVEGTLFRAGAGEGRWSRDAGVLRLTPPGSTAELRLLAGDDNVLFFLGRDLKPLVGTADYSYTLNRRKPASPRRG